MFKYVKILNNFIMWKSLLISAKTCKYSTTALCVYRWLIGVLLTSAIRNIELSPLTGFTDDPQDGLYQVLINKTILNTILDKNMQNYTILYTNTIPSQIN